MMRIELRGIGKTFRANHAAGALARLTNLLSRDKHETQVMTDINLDVPQGKVLGIIGGNGSGKSTLLRIIAGIYRPDTGSVRTTGKVISIINLTAGLQDRLTLSDNIYLCCALFGLPTKLISERAASIVHFAGLESMEKTKIYTFSEGMKQRLAFSMAIHCEPDVLLLDEVFEVGDEAFRTKSQDYLRKLLKQGLSVVLVTHDLDLLKKHADSVALIEHGRLVIHGATKTVISKYERNAK